MTLSHLALLVAYAVPLAALWALHARWRVHRSRKAQAALTEAVESGLTEPASLHPVIDPTLCLGCGACVRACPEKKILGIVHGKALLVEPTSCIGHGACREACPFDAITLVFGTEKRGVDIPLLDDNFETNVPGVFIAGELGGMGLIRNAIEQGRQALEAIAQQGGRVAGGDYDVVIVGAGPAGFAASLAAMEKGLRFVTLEQETLGGAVAHYPRGKLVMTAPAQLPIVGKVQFSRTSKEELLSFWRDVERRTGVAIQYEERVEAVQSSGGRTFEVRSNKGTYRTRCVLLAIGRRGTPRKLGAPGEEQDKVVYRLVDPEQYAGQRVLVVGGGDSALEAAASIAEAGGETVALAYRGAAFNRAKAANRRRVEALAQERCLDLMFESEVFAIGTGDVTLKVRGEQEVTLDNDAVIVCAGGVLPFQFLRDIGIEVETKFGQA